METLYGLSNWQLTLRRESDHVVILRAVTCDQKAALPDRLFDLPVTVLEDHALAPNARPAQGEQVTITCGLPRGEWDNRRLQDLTLPAHLEALGPYALYGCGEMHTLRLHDRVDRWGPGCLMNCRSLRHICLTRTQALHGPALAYLCGEIHEELAVDVTETDGSHTRLIFPEFTEVYEENFPAHHFDYIIYGGGHPYHMGFPQKQLQLHLYDDLWDKFLGEEHDPACALQLALCRLRWPTGLRPGAEGRYWDYVVRHGEEALLQQLDQKDLPGLRLLLYRLDPKGDLLHRLCHRARQARFTEGLALLLERQRGAASGFEKDFDL